MTAKTIVRRSAWIVVSAISLIVLLLFPISLFASISYVEFSFVFNRHERWLLLSRGAIICSAPEFQRASLHFVFDGWKGIAWLPAENGSDPPHNAPDIPLWPAVLAILVLVVPRWIRTLWRARLRRVVQRCGLAASGMFVCMIASNHWIELDASLESGKYDVTPNGGYLSAEGALFIIRGGRVILLLCADTTASRMVFNNRVVSSPSMAVFIRDKQEPLEFGWPTRTVSQYGGITYELPIWLPLFASLFTAILLRTRRDRRRPGHCTSCGYDLTGNVSGVCPECGTPLTAASLLRE